MARDDHAPPDEARQTDAQRSKALPRSPSTRTFWPHLLLVLASLAIAFVALEVALSFTHYRYLTHPSVEFPRGYHVKDPDLGVDLAQNYPPATFRMQGPSSTVFTNQWGCFDHDDPVGDNYLLAIGDSSTWGFAELKDKWTTHLETLSGHRILKCGVSGTGTKHQEIKGRKTIAKIGISPTVIPVLYDTWNDLNDDALFPGESVVDGYRVDTLKSLDLRTGKLVRHTSEELEGEYRRYRRAQESFSLTRYLTDHLTTVALIRQTLGGLYSRYVAPADDPIVVRPGQIFLWNVDSARYPWVDEAIEEHLDNIRALRQLAEEHGAELVLITDGIPDEGLHRRLLAFLESEIPYHIDVAEPIAQAAQGRRVRYHHDSHWNALGNRLAGEIIHQYLSDAGLLQPRTISSRVEP